MLEGQQPASGVIYRRLAQRSLDGADVVVGEPIRQRTNSTQTIASAKTTMAIPASHRMPRGHVAQRFDIGKR